MIADATEQNIAAVNYHFGNKQNLLISALRLVLEKIMTPVASGPAGDKAAAKRELVSYISERCKFLLSDRAPTWYGRLIVRAGFEMSFTEAQNGLEFYKPDFDYLEKLAIRLKPDLKADRARLWAYSVVGQIFFYVFGRDMILLAGNKTSFDAATIKKVARHIVEMSSAWLTEPCNTRDNSAAAGRQKIKNTLNKALKR
jgi:AcrR family transcriptional regulator